MCDAFTKRDSRFSSSSGARRLTSAILAALLLLVPLSGAGGNGHLERHDRPLVHCRELDRRRSNQHQFDRHQ